MPLTTLRYRTLRAVTDLSIPVLKRDNLLTTDINGGVRFLMDLYNAYCYNADTAPSNGKTFKDMANVSADGTINVTGGSLSHAGNGIDFTAVTSRGCLSMPASVSANLWDDQEFVICAYYKLPAVPAVVGGSASTTLITSQAANGDHYGASPELVMSNFNTATLGRIAVNRITALNTTETRQLDFTTHAGLVTQLGVYRTASGWGARLKSSAGTTLGTGTSPNAKNTLDFSAKGIHFGPSGAFGIKDPYAAKTDLRLFRAWVENLHISLRDPIAVLDQDYSETIARNVYS